MHIFVPKGEYEVLFHRSVQWEIQQETIANQDEATLEIQLQRAYETDLISIDSHTHSSPSGDGKLSMEQRLITHAAHQIDVHISTDHDHLVDYQPTLEAPGIAKSSFYIGWCRSESCLRGTCQHVSSNHRYRNQWRRCSLVASRSEYI